MTTVTETRTLTTRRGRSIQTTLSDAEALRICSELPNGFARDLARSAVGPRGLSPDQVAWTHILATEELDRRRREAPSDPTEPALFVPGIAEMFRRAIAPQASGVGRQSQGLKQPEIHLPLPDSHAEIRLFVHAAQNARFPGWIAVAPARTTIGPRPQLFGRIDPEGTFHAIGQPDPDVLATLAVFHDDPAGFAARCGRLSGRCCFCHQGLTDARSLAMGYGPICAKRYQLPYGVERGTLEAITKEITCGV
jgi:hypothetical protein